MTIPVDVQGAFNKDGVPVDVEAVANVKVSGEDQAIANAVERFLEGAKNQEHLQNTVRQTLEGHLRSIVGTLSIEELNSDRKAFAQSVTNEAVVDLQKMGVMVDSIVIKKIADKGGYLESLGKRRTAEVKRDADIGVAQAESEAKKKTTDAQRDAATIAAENERQIAEANKKLDVQKAKYLAEVNKEQAIAEQEGPKAKAEAEKAVLVAQQMAKAAETEAAVFVQTKEAERNEQELIATQLKPAEINRQSTIIKAEAEASARLKKAEGESKAIEREADASAAKIRKEGEAKADAERSQLVARAEGKRAELLAEAEGIKAKLLAEAEGKEKLAEALKKLNEAGQLLFLMEKSPEVIRALGEAGGNVARGVFEPLGTSLSSIDSLTVYDSGNSGNGKSAVNRLTDIVPSMVFDFLAKCKANGLDDIGGLLTNLVKFANEKLTLENPAKEE